MISYNLNLNAPPMSANELLCYLFLNIVIKTLMSLELSMIDEKCTRAVSYTHLDVYKRQLNIQL